MRLLDVLLTKMPRLGKWAIFRARIHDHHFPLIYAQCRNMGRGRGRAPPCIFAQKVKTKLYMLIKYKDNKIKYYISREV